MDIKKIIFRYPYYFATYYLLNYWISYIPIWKVRYLYLKLLGCAIKPTSTINMKNCIIFPNQLEIGSYTHINSNCLIDARGSIKIGNNVSISFNVSLVTGTHDIHTPDFKYKTGRIEIEDYVWIGINATILPNVKIGKGAIIASGAVVTHDVSPMTIVAGIPAKKIGERKIKENIDYHCKWNTPFA